MEDSIKIVGIADDKDGSELVKIAFELNKDTPFGKVFEMITQEAKQEILEKLNVLFKQMANLFAGAACTVSLFPSTVDFLGQALYEHAAASFATVEHLLESEKDPRNVH